MRDPSATPLTPLPPGRHGLPREFVARNSHERLIAGAAAAIAERGYAKVTITAICRHARLSRRTFYEHFASKEKCLKAVGERFANQEHDKKVTPIQPATDGAADLSRLAHIQKDPVGFYQRERLMSGIAKAAEERGYAKVTVSDICRHAGTSRDTFYKHFANRYECFEAAYGASLESFIEKEGRQRFGSPVTSGKGHASRSCNSRERLIAGAAEAIAERGYAKVTVADIYRYSGLYRAAFYDHFADKYECFEAARGISLIPESEE